MFHHRCCVCHRSGHPGFVLAVALLLLVAGVLVRYGEAIAAAAVTVDAVLAWLPLAVGALALGVAAGSISLALNRGRDDRVEAQVRRGWAAEGRLVALPVPGRSVELEAPPEPELALEAAPPVLRAVRVESTVERER